MESRLFLKANDAKNLAKFVFVLSTPVHDSNFGGGGNSFSLTPQAAEYSDWLLKLIFSRSIGEKS